MTTGVRRRPLAPVLQRGALGLFLILSSAAILYTTAQNQRAVETLSLRALESTALALSYAADGALRAGGGEAEAEMRRILADRVVAYALIAGEGGEILFHTNPALAGSRLAEPPGEAARAGRAAGHTVTLGTGLPGFEYDYPLRRTDGRRRTLRIVLHAAAAERIRSDAGRMWWTVGAVVLLLWSLGIALDRAMARQLRQQAEADRRERLALIGRMTATLAHEIRNALGSVKGYTQWVNEKVDPSDPRKAGLENALRATGRIESLVNELLLYSRQESYEIARVELAPLLHETVEAEAARWPGRVEIDVPAGTSALADSGKLERVIRNAVRNAMEAMGAEGTLRVVARASRRWTEIRVEDSGPGVPEADLARLFTPFHTSKADGTGLGLAYSKKAVEGMGGRIELWNRDGGAGAVLQLTLRGRE